MTTEGKALPAGVVMEQIKMKMAEMQKQMDELVNPPPAPDAKPLRLDLGCSSNKREGFLGVDYEQRLDKDGKPCVDIVHDLSVFPWPWADGSVDEVNCSHVLEHIPGKDYNFELVKDSVGALSLKKTIARPRALFFNELCRVMKKGAKALFVTPHWASNRAYGDITHEWPPVSEMSWFYLDHGWRVAQTPHLSSENRSDDPNAYTCDFSATWGYSPAPWLAGRNKEFIETAMSCYKEAAQDMITTVVKK